MTILTIRTDNPQAELCLYINTQLQDNMSWQADRQLSDTIHLKIRDLLDKNKLSLHDLDGVVIYKGPGSFTGLRIGFSVGNAMASSLKIPIIATSGDDWQALGVEELDAGKNEIISMPEYGAEPNITKPKK